MNPTQALSALVESIVRSVHNGMMEDNEERNIRIGYYKFQSLDERSCTYFQEKPVTWMDTI